MRVLLDESQPRPLAKLLVGHEVQTVVQAGWASLANGELLRRAAATFDVLVTADQNLEFQQNVSVLPVAVVILVAESNRLVSLEPVVPDGRVGPGGGGTPDRRRGCSAQRHNGPG